MEFHWTVLALFVSRYFSEKMLIVANGHGFVDRKYRSLREQFHSATLTHEQIKSTLLHKNNGLHTNTHTYQCKHIYSICRHCSISVKQVVALPTIPMCKYLRFDLVVLLRSCRLFIGIRPKHCFHAHCNESVFRCVCVLYLESSFDGIPEQSRVMQRLLNVRCCLLLRHFDIPNVFFFSFGQIGARCRIILQIFGCISVALQTVYQFTKATDERHGWCWILVAY